MGEGAIDLQVINWVLMACIAAVSAVCAVIAAIGRGHDKDTDTLEAIASLRTDIRVVGSQVTGIVSDVADIKAETRSHSAQLSEMATRVERISGVADNALAQAKAANRRLDDAGISGSHPR